MKTHLKRISKSTLAVVLTLCMLFSCVMATNAAVVSDSGVLGAFAGDSVGNLAVGDYIFLDGAGNVDRASIYWHTDGSWSSMTRITGTNVFYVAVPSGKTSSGFNICRMNSGTTTNDWDNRWNQTDDISASNNNWFHFDSYGSGNRFNYTASQIKMYSSISTYNGQALSRTSGRTYGYTISSYTPSANETAEFKAYDGRSSNGWYWGDSNTSVSLTKGVEYSIVTSINIDNAVASNTKISVTATPKSYTISYKDRGNTTYSGSNLSSLPTSHTSGTATTLVDGVKSGYTFDGWYTASTGGTKVTSLSATGYNANTTLYAAWTKNNEALAAPAITYNNSSAATQTMNAAKGSKARIAWSAVSNAGSYEVFKGGVSQGTTTNLYYDIERGYSYGGAYTVKAVPSDTTNYSTSAASNSITFTFNKVALTAPTVTPSATTILRNQTVTFSISGGASSGTLGTDYKYQHSGANNTSYSDVSGSSWTTGALDNTTTSDVSDVFKFKTVAISTDYYSDSTSTTDKTITVKPAFGVDSSNTALFNPDTATAMEYNAATGYYSLAVTLTDTSNYYFRINQMGANPKWSTGWNGSYPSVYDVNVDGDKVTANSDVSGWDNKASMHYNGSAKKIIIWFDYANKKVWITGNSTKYAVTITQPTATGSSLKVNDATTSPQEFYDGDTVNYSVTAGSGNVITGVTINGTTTSVDRKTSYTGSFEISAATTITATVVPQYSITKSSATGGTYTVKRGSTEVTTFIAGDSLTLTPTAAAHYDFTKFTVTGGKSATLTANPSTLDTTGATGNITITPTWTPKAYTVSVEAKYSTDGTNFDQSFTTAPAVTIGANTATYVSGVSVTAPATDPTGYVFAGWTSSKGTFANAANKDTTFKPNANDAVAVATYKKIFTITSSVDSTGTGAGTVSTNKTEVEAGGSYTITATAKSGSAIESITVNSTSKGTSSSTTVSGVSADQTVIVKFKSNVYLKGTMNATAWAGDVMTANSAGTSYTISEVTLNAGTTYEFKHWVDSGGDGTWNYTEPTWTLNSIASHSTKADGYGGTNLTITPSVKAKVTFVSDGTKFTSITAIPYDSTTYNVTLTQSADYTITATYMGVEYTTSGKSANVTVPVYSATAFSYTVTPANGKYLSAVAQSNSVALSPAFSLSTHAASYTGTVSSVSKAFAVSATTANTIAITAKSNKTARGTVEVSPTSAYPGQTVTITVTEKSGTLASLTYSYGSPATTVTLYPTGVGAAAPVSLSRKESLSAVGARMEAFSEIGSTYTFTMPSSAVTVNATFDAYSAESDWYYNGYDTSGNALSGYHSKQMTEGIIGGQKFSYYHVEGRTGSDQLMTVSNGQISTGTRYVYFTQLKSGGWDYSHAPSAYFMGSSDSWPGTQMEWYTDNEFGEPIYRIDIPSGATGVVFNDGNTHKSSDINDLAAGGYYVDEYSEWNGSESVHAGHTYSCSYPSAGTSSSGTEYFYQDSTYNGDYTADFSTKGFYNHNTASKEFAKPKDLGSNTGDYYINVLYPNTSYTINGVTKTTGSNPMIIWSAEPLAGEDDAVKVYAKDGSIRSDSSGSTYANIADTKIYAADGTTTVGTKRNGNIANQTYEIYNGALGDTIVIKTQIGATDSGTLSDAAALKAKYFVRGFCVNGEVPALLEWNADGLYTLTYQIPEDYEGKTIEITPIYYLKDTSTYPVVTYRVTGFTDALKEVGTGKPNWGDTLYTYPFYGTNGGQNNAFGAYPGQPMVYYKGQYQMQIPQKDTAWDPYSGTDATELANTSVSGITMSNGYYDLVHRQIMGYGDDSTSSDHVQTYDYGDFYKIFNEKKPVDNIVFDFKYETKKHNLTDIITTATTASALTDKYGDTNGNGFELLTNFHGRAVDLFGTPLSGDAADPSKTKPLYVVSIGGVNGTIGVENIAGYYATEWNVYAPTTTTGTPASSDAYSRVSGGGKNSIPPEVLILNDDDTESFNTTTYPSAVAEGSGEYNYAVTDWKELYTALEAYRGIPVLVSYEKASMQVGAKNHTTSGAGGATRNDGRWLYSKNGESITSTIKIQYSNDNGATYTDLNATTPQVSGLSAYFTNAEADGEMTYSTTIDPDKTFDFEAKTTNAEYKFVGWYMADGTKITSDNASHTERSGSYTFLARFMEVQGGQLILSHSVDTNETYKGAGTATIAVVVKNDSDETIRTITATTSDITLDDKVISSDKTGYTIEVTLNATATGEDTYALTNTTAAATFFGGQTQYTSMPQTFSFTVGSLFTNTTQNVKSLIYHSYFTKTEYNYSFTFNYPGRLANKTTQTYKVSGTLTAAQREAYVTGTGNESRVLSEGFLNNLAPYESNFNQSLKWEFTAADRTFAQSGSNYSLTKEFTAKECTGEETEGITPRSTKRTAIFDLPFAHDALGHANNTETMEETTTPNLSITVDYGTLIIAGSGVPEGTAYEDRLQYYVTAPKTLTNNGATKYFQYWSIFDDAEKTHEVARNYFTSFNFLAYDNYYITPYYSTEETVAGKNVTGASISFLEVSRNQWNNGGKGSYTKGSDAADVLFNDMAVAYTLADGSSVKDSTAEVGVIVQRLDELKINNDGTPDTSISSYTSDYATISDADLATIQGLAADASSNKNGLALDRKVISHSNLDNKDRTEYCYSMYNSNNGVEKTSKKYVYRAFSFIVMDGVATLSETPVYFIVYDEATK